VVVLAGMVSADPVQRRMPSGDEVWRSRSAGRSGGGWFGFPLSPGTYKLVGTSGDAYCELLLTLSAGQYVDFEIACHVRRPRTFLPEYRRR
jgi:hypothetical protein